MPKQSKKNTKEFIQAVGRRKEAVARARIYSLGKEKELRSEEHSLNSSHRL